MCAARRAAPGSSAVIYRPTRLSLYLSVCLSDCLRGTYGTPEAGTRTQYVQCVGPWGQAALRLRHVYSAGGWYAQPYVPYGGRGACVSAEAWAHTSGRKWLSTPREASTRRLQICGETLVP